MYNLSSWGKFLSEFPLLREILFSLVLILKFSNLLIFVNKVTQKIEKLLLVNIEIQLYELSKTDWVIANLQYIILNNSI